MKTKSLILLLFALAALTACSPAAAIQPGSLTLTTGQTATSADGSLSVTFVKILQDSRCPQGAMCIWAGQVQVLLEIRKGAETQQYTLTLGDLSDGSINSIPVAGYQITLAEVTPFPQVSHTIAPADYAITLDFQAK